MCVCAYLKCQYIVENQLFAETATRFNLKPLTPNHDKNRLSELKPLRETSKRVGLNYGEEECLS